MAFSDNEKTKLMIRFNNLTNAFEAFSGVRRSDFPYTPEGDRAYLEALQNVRMVINNQFNHILPRQFAERTKSAKNYTDRELAKFKDELMAEKEAIKSKTQRAVIFPHVTDILSPPRPSLWSRILKATKK